MGLSPFSHSPILEEATVEGNLRGPIEDQPGVLPSCCPKTGARGERSQTERVHNDKRYFLLYLFPDLTPS